MKPAGRFLSVTVCLSSACVAFATDMQVDPAKPNVVQFVPQEAKFVRFVIQTSS